MLNKQTRLAVAKTANIAKRRGPQPPALKSFDFDSILAYLATDPKGRFFNASNKCECCGQAKPTGLFITSDRFPFHLCATCRGALRALMRTAKRITA